MQQNRPMNILVLRIVWGALLGSQVMYGIALKYVIADYDVAPESANPFYIPMFSSLGIVLFFAAIFFQRLLLKGAKEQLQKKFGAVDLSKLNIEDLIQAFYSPCIIRLALFESVALFGFGLAFLHKDFNLFIPFVSVCMVAYFFNFPTEEKIRNAFKS